MKPFIVLAVLLAAGSASAQPLEEVTTRETIELRVQQTRTFTFNTPVKEIKLAAKGVAEVLPESDRTFNFRGLSQGETLFTAYGQNGNVLYRANIAVQDAAGLVKIYGQGDGKGGNTKDYIGFYCGDLGCSRGDTDKAPTPFSTTITEQKDGVSFSREYR